MLDEIEIIVPEPRHLGQVERWAARNDALKALLKLPRSYSAKDSGHQSWVAIRNDEVLGIVTVETNKEHVGYLNCVIKPSNQRQGIGSRLIEYALGQPGVKDLIHLHSVIEPSNTAARKILNNNGFSRVGYSADGGIEFARHKH